MTVARRVYVPDNGKREKATLPNGQYVSLEVATAVVVIIMESDVSDGAMVVAAEAAVVAAVVVIVVESNS